MINTIESAKSEIVDAWLAQENVLGILHKYKVSPFFFKKHFASRIFQSFMKVVYEKKTVEGCPVLYVLLHFANKQLIPFHEIFLIYAGLKNEIFSYFRVNATGRMSGTEYRVLAQHFDIFFSGLIQDVMEQASNTTDFTKLSEVIDSESKPKQSLEIDNRIKDIRFSKEERYGSDTLFEMLDGMIFDKIEQFIVDLDELLLLLYDMEEVESEQARYLMARAIQRIDQFYHLVDIMVVFPVIANTFKNLCNFLKDLDDNFYNNIEQKNSLILNLIGLIKDLEQWIDVIFVKRIADDVHYLDASFANNVLEIESICSQKQTITNSEEDLEFF